MAGKGTRSVHSTIFLSYLVLMLVTVVSFTVVFSVFTSRLLQRRAIDSLKAISASLASGLDAEISKMNILSINMSCSAMLKELIARYGAFPASPVTSRARLEKYQAAKRITDVMSTLIGPFKPVPQANFFSLGGEMIGAGIYSQAARRSVRDVPWLDGVAVESGSKSFAAPHRDMLLEATFPLYKNTRYISLCRTVFTAPGSPAGIIEVKQFTNMIFKHLSGADYRMAVFDADGAQIFPSVDDPPPSRRHSPARRAEILARAADGDVISLGPPETRRREIGIVRLCRESDWRLLVSKEEASLLKPVRDFTLVLLLGSLVFLACVLLISARLATTITTPLTQMREAITAMDWESISSGSPPPVSSGVGELEALQLAFQSMQRKLQESMHQALESRTREMQARMVALQAQMDPHFVYNILANIGIMAEEGLTGEISASVEHLTLLLRYISSSKESLVPIGEEMQYARRYLACMKIRFRDSLSYDMRVPEAILGIKVPKLIVQPIIENAVKYGTNREPPWRIAIEGVRLPDGWTICVSDNGPGFPAEQLERLRGDRARDGRGDGMAINGMGLRSISQRLQLLYAEKAFFTAENGAHGGARVTIGGPNEPARAL